MKWMFKMDVQNKYRKLIQKHIRKGYLRDKALGKRIVNVPIYDLIHDDKDLYDFIKKDKPIFCYYKNDDEYRTVTAPHMISIFLSMLELSESDEILILGAKGGFISAIIANIAHHIIILEEHPEVAKITMKNLEKLKVKNAKVIIKNPLLGLKDLGPYNKILVTGAIEEIPQNIFDQLEIYGILVAPMIITGDNQQVVQFVKRREEIEEVNFGGVLFQDLYYSKIEYTAKKIKEIQVRSQAFLDTYANLPQVQISDLAFNSNFNKRTQNLDIKFPTYRIYCRIKNNTSTKLSIQLKLEMPSLEKENLPIKIRLPPNSETTESLIISKPETEGKHDFNLIVCDDENFRLDKVESCVEIKRSKKKKILDITLIILKLTL